MPFRSSFARRLPPRLGLAALLACLGCGDELQPRRSNLLLITVDTLRADHLSSYGYARQTSPVIDALAERGVRFDLPVVQWPKTGPSFASIFTATYPKDNGIVRKIGDRLPDEFRMLAEVLKEQGYATRAVVANGAVASEFNFHQGFEVYVESWKLPEPAAGVDPTGAAMVTQLARTVMEDHDPAQPYLLWLHYLDPHFPYQAPEPWTDRFEGDAVYDGTQKIEISRDRPQRQMMGIGFEQALDDRDELAYYIARYDAEIAYVDHHIGELLKWLGQRQLLNGTLIAITSDHGESLGEHNYFFDHGRFSFQTCLKVPLIFHYPGVLEPRVDSEPVELIHLAPTLLEAAGIELPQGRWMQGRSLWPRLRGLASREESDRYAFSEAGYALHRNWQRAITDGRYKLIHAADWAEQRWIAGKGNPLALYDLHHDPDETENLVDRLPEEARRLQQALHKQWSGPGFEARVEAPTAAEQREMDDETRAQLKALGYLQ